MILAGLYLSGSTKLEVIVSYSEEKKTMIVLITYVACKHISNAIVPPLGLLGGTASNSVMWVLGSCPPLCNLIQKGGGEVYWAQIPVNLDPKTL